MSEQNPKPNSASDSLLHSDVFAQVLGPDAIRMLRCGICMEFFDIPIVLPCGHTFCLHCLTEMCRHAGLKHSPIGKSLLTAHKDVRVSCPNCRVLIYASPIIERNVTCNFIIQSLLECLKTRHSVKSTTQGVNTDELRMTGRTRGLSDLEMSCVTSEVDRLVACLGRSSVLDLACLEVDEIRRQHLQAGSSGEPHSGLAARVKKCDFQAPTSDAEKSAQRCQSGDDGTKSQVPPTPSPMKPIVIMAPNTFQQQHRYVPPPQRHGNLDQPQNFCFQQRPPNLNISQKAYSHQTNPQHTYQQQHIQLIQQNQFQHPPPMHQPQKSQQHLHLIQQSPLQQNQQIKPQDLKYQQQPEQQERQQRHHQVQPSNQSQQAKQDQLPPMVSQQQNQTQQLQNMQQPQSNDQQSQNQHQQQQQPQQPQLQQQSTLHSFQQPMKNQNNQQQQQLNKQIPNILQRPQNEQQQHQQRKYKKQSFIHNAPIGTKPKNAAMQPVKKENQFQINAHISDVTRILHQNPPPATKHQAPLVGDFSDLKEGHCPGGFKFPSVWHTYGPPPSADPPDFTRCPPPTNVMVPPSSMSPSSSVYTPSSIFPQAPGSSVTSTARGVSSTSTTSTTTVISSANIGPQMCSVRSTQGNKCGPNLSGPPPQKPINDPAIMSYSFAASAKTVSHK